MFTINFVEDDALHTVEVIAKKDEPIESVKARANAQYFELLRPGVTNVTPFIDTVDIQFYKGGRVYTYFVNHLLVGYTKAHIKDHNGDYRTVDIICSKRRSVEELRAIAKTRGFEYNQYKVLHGIAVA